MVIGTQQRSRRMLFIYESQKLNSFLEIAEVKIRADDNKVQVIRKRQEFE